MKVMWHKCGKDGHWCSLRRLDLNSITNDEGIYVIWQGGNPPRAVRLGQGDPISGRLSTHRNDKKILAYATGRELLVTWASIAPEYRDGVERYLADELDPLIGDAFPDAEPIPVNSPW